MRYLPKALVIAGITTTALAAPLAQAADAGEALPSVKLSVYSEYEYRGISQTSEKPAGQLNIDWAHSSGFYLGTFVSNIKWLKDTAEVNGFSTSANIEWDIFGGYKFEIAKDVVLDVGYLRYEYPSSGAFSPKPNTDEAYVGISYGPYSAKYSYSFNDTFGVPESKGSDFLEFNYAREVLPKLTATAHLGHQKYKGTQIHGFHNGDLSYTVWKLGASYDLGNGWAVGGYYKDTNAKSELYTVKDRDWSKGRLVAFASKTF